MNQLFRYNLSLCCLALSILSAAGQPVSCGFDPMRERLFGNHPEARVLQETLEQKRYERLAQPPGYAAAKGPAATYTIPVVVHIIHLNGAENISDAQVIKGIDWLNAAFANAGYYDQGNGVPTPFQFCLARQTPDGEVTNGIIRRISPLTSMTMETQDLAVKNLSRWNPQHYLNIWLVRAVTSQSSGPGVAGYAYFPASHGTDIDGVVMEAEFFGKNEADNSVLTHEVGHYFGLYHTFEGGCTNSDCAKDGDRVCDTPPDQSTAWLPCGTPANTCSTDTQSGFSTDQEDMTINYMDYATLSCYNAFTAGQRDRMEFFMTEVRASLLDSKGCLDPCTQPVSAAFTASAGATIPVGVAVQFTASDPTAQTYAWKTDAGVFATGPNASISFSTLGQHIVTLDVGGTDANCLATVSDTFWVVCDVQASFDIFPPVVQVGNTVTFTSTATGNVADLVWTLDGNPAGDAPVWSESFSAPGVHAVCLTAAGAYCPDVSCLSFEVTDSSGCLYSFVKKIDYGHDIHLYGTQLKPLPGGGLLAVASLPSKRYGLLRYSQQGDLVYHREIIPDDGQAISDVHITADGHALLLTSFLASGSVCYLAKVNYTTGQVVWYKKIESFSPLYLWTITENPVNQHYQVFGKSLNHTQVVVLDINPGNGDIISQKNFPGGEVPLVRSGLWVGDAFFGAGTGSLGGNTGSPFLAKFDAAGQVIWSKQYDFAVTGLFGSAGAFTWSEIKRDNNHFVLTGANNAYAFFLKTDLNGQPVTARVFYSGLIIDYHSHTDRVNIEVLEDGYLLGFGIYGSTYFIKTDFDGNIAWKKNLVNPAGFNGFDMVAQDDHLFAFGARVFVNDELYLLKSPLIASPLAECISDSLPISVATPTWSVQSYTPQPLVAPQLMVTDRFAFSQPLPQTLETLCSSALCPEICNNNLDDDGDGLTDCADAVDCPCNNGLPDCAIPLPPVVPKISGRVEWKSAGNSIEPYRQTIVANLNPQQESIPEILAITYNPDINMPRHIRIYTGDGSNAANPAQLTMTGTYFNSPASMAVGDLDGNGVPELVVVFNNKHLRVFSNYNPQVNPVMTTMLQANLTQSSSSHVALADFNGDGRSEIFIGQQVFALEYNPLGQPQLINIMPALFPPVQNSYHSFAADILSVEDCNGDPDCAGLELVTGTTIFSVDLDNTAQDGDPRAIIARRTVDAVSGGGVYADGPAVVADVDLDGVPDVVVRAQPPGLAKSYLYVWNAQKFIKQIAYPDFGPLGAIGLPSVAEVFDDTQKGAAKNLPEIFFSAPYRLYCLNLNAAEMDPANPFWWSVPVNDPYNFSNPVSTFDFDGNGQPEVVFRDQESLHVLYGGNVPFPAGVNPDRSWFKIPGKSGTNEEYPVIADVDSDGQAEIVFTGGNPPQSLDPYADGQLIVVGADLIKSGPWKPTRRLWNQFSYAPHLINDDLSIPAVLQKNHLEMPAGSGYRPLNIVLGQKPVPAFYNGYVYLPDAVPEVVETRCAGNNMEVRLRVCNMGSSALPAGTPIRFYIGNPTVTAATLLPNQVALSDELAADSCVHLVVLLPKQLGQKIYAVVNDNGSKPPPFNLSTDFPLTGFVECDFTNNMTDFELPPALAKPDLGPDVAVCEKGVWTFSVGSGFQNYRWSTLSTDTTVTVYEPGTYWVEVTDICGLVIRDTVVVSVNPAGIVSLGPDRKICQDSTIQLQATPGFEQYTWFPATDLSCADCPNPVAQPSQSRTYTVQVKSPLGCFSFDTVFIQVNLPQNVVETVEICAGDSALVFGNYETATGTYSRTFQAANGCDSVHRVELAVLPVFQTTELRELCAGDSLLVFGNYEITSGTYSRTFQAANGCDSVHRVELAVLPVFQTTKLQEICAGDSLLVFGNYEITSGTYSRTFQAANGCDSVHRVELAVLPVFQTTELREICAGDSLLVFGNYETASGLYIRTFQAANGCDSVHRVDLMVLPVFQTTELREICAGDSLLIFGNYETATGTYSRTFQAANGCDSVHRVELMVLPVFQTTELQEICAGDSLLVFGNYETASGMYSRTFQAANGCDSVHRMELAVLPVFQTTELREICAGDSLLVFGNYETASGTYSRTFQAANGCDSVHQVELAVLPVFQTTELREICAGDSLLVFGNYEITSGTYSRTFQAANGCDSVHRVELMVLPVFQTTELQEICAGDSLLVFGNYEITAGTYSRTFQAANGCDSVHRVELMVLPVFQTTELQEICVGDSLLIFGNYETASGLYIRTFQAANSCDSVHQVELAVLPVFQTTELRQICTGDSALVFGNFETAAGLYSRTFQASGGCDSIHTVALAVFPEEQTAEFRQICTGDSSLVFGFYEHTAGVYTRVFQTQHGCDSTHTITLTVLPALETLQNLSVCTGDSILIFGQYVRDAGVYTGIFQAVGGCDSVVTITLQERMAPVLDLLWLDPTCFGNADGQLIIENAPTGVLFSLDGAPFSTVQVYAALPFGAHVLRVRDTVGCISEIKTTLLEPPPLLVYLPGDTLIEQGQFVEIQSEVLGDAAQYTWSPGAGLDCPICPVVLAKPAETTLYTLTVRDLSGCTASDQIQIAVQPKPSNKVYVPNVFRPDSGGSNQFFTVYAGNDVREVIRLDVYDRWGDLVFRREHFAPGVEVLGWNGAARGQPVPPGVYVYSAEVAFSDGTTGWISGDVMVVR